MYLYISHPVTGLYPYVYLLSYFHLLYVPSYPCLSVFLKLLSIYLSIYLEKKGLWIQCHSGQHTCQDRTLKMMKGDWMTLGWAVTMVERMTLKNSVKSTTCSRFAVMEQVPKAMSASCRRFSPGGWTQKYTGASKTHIMKRQYKKSLYPVHYSDGCGMYYIMESRSLVIITLWNI